MPPAKKTPNAYATAFLDRIDLSTKTTIPAKRKSSGKDDSPAKARKTTIQGLSTLTGPELEVKEKEIDDAIRSRTEENRKLEVEIKKVEELQVYFERKQETVANSVMDEQTKNKIGDAFSKLDGMVKYVNGVEDDDDES